MDQTERGGGKVFQWLAAKIIRDWDRTERVEVRTAYGQMASILAICSNGVLFVIKLLVGMAAGSVAVVADGINNLSDAASNIISLLGFRLAARPADAEHPYGHGRYEYLAGLTVAVLILAAGLELLKSSVERIFHPAAPDFSWVMAAALAGSILVKLWMMLFNLDAGRRIDSRTLFATAADSRNDAIATGIVLAGMITAHFTGLDLDGWLGVGVALFVLYSGFSLVRDTLDLLLGRKPEPEVIEAIRERIMACPGVVDTHDLMLHDYGPGQRFASAHVEMAAEDDIMVMHKALVELSREFLEKDGLHIVFQLDPISQEDTEENRLRKHMAAHVDLVDPRLTVHDLCLTRAEDGDHVRFDCFVPADIDIPEQEMKKILTNMAREIYPDAEIDVTIDRDYMAPPH